MEGKAEMLNLSLRPLLHTPVKAIVFLISIIIISVFNTVKKVKIKIVNAAAGKLLLKNPVPVLRS